MCPVEQKLNRWHNRVRRRLYGRPLTYNNHVFFIRREEFAQLCEFVADMDYNVFLSQGKFWRDQARAARNGAPDLEMQYRGLRVRIRPQCQFIRNHNVPR